MMSTMGTQVSSSALIEGMKFGEVPDTLDSVQNVQWVEYRSTNQLNGNVIDILVPGSSDFIDLRRSFLSVKFKVTKADGTALAATDHIGTANNMLSSLWSQVEVYLNGTLVSPNVNLFPHTSMFNTYLEKSLRQKSTIMRSSGFYHDTARYANTNDPGNTFNQGLKTRYGLIAESKQCNLYGPLPADVLECSKWLVGGVDVQLRLTQSSPEFFFIKPTKVATVPKIELLDVYYHVCRITPKPEVLLAQNIAISQNMFRYDYQRRRNHVIPLKTGATFLQEDQMFNNVIPGKVVVAHINQAGFSGSYLENPFYVRNVEVSTIALYVNDMSVPAQPMKLDFANSDFLQGFMNMYSGYGRDTEEFSNGLTPEEFFHAYCFFVFDLKGGLGKDLLDVKTKANVRLEVTYKKGVDKDLAVVVHGIFPDTFSIDSSRNVYPSAML